jgi:hypothetical protein
MEGLSILNRFGDIGGFSFYFCQSLLVTCLLLTTVILNQVLGFPDVVLYKSNALTKKAAICARVTESVGQYNGGFAEQPRVMPRTAISSMCP